MSTTVSVIIPAYNAGKHIEECLSSVCGQSHRELQILVHDDGSKDDTAEKLKALAAKLWILPKTRTVQTELELGEGIVPEMDIKEGAEPSACPFAIVSEKQFGRMDTAKYTAEHIEYGGVILTPEWVKLV